jgi:hypothetical protein
MPPDRRCPSSGPAFLVMHLLQLRTKFHYGQFAGSYEFRIRWKIHDSHAYTTSNSALVAQNHFRNANDIISNSGKAGHGEGMVTQSLTFVCPQIYQGCSNFIVLQASPFLCTIMGRLQWTISFRRFKLFSASLGHPSSI